ncbi:MAG: hypothetical protein V1821_02385 [bacterium]
MPVSFDSLPEKIQDQIFSNDFALREEECFANLPEDRRKKVAELLIKTYLREISISDFAAGVQAAVPGEAGKDLTKHLLGWNLIRIRGWFSEDVGAVLTSLGGNPDDYRHKKNLDEALDKALEGVDVVLIPARTRSAVMFKMGEFLNGKIDQSTLLENMTKSLKIGGWGWDQNIAMPVISRLKALREEAEESDSIFVPKEELTPKPAPRAPKSSEPAPDPWRALLEEQELSDDSLDELFTELAGGQKVPTEKAALEETSDPDFLDELLSEFAEIEGSTDSGQVPEHTPEEYVKKFSDILDFPHRGEPHGPKPEGAFEQALHSSDILLEHELKEIEDRKADLAKDVPATAIVVASALEAMVDQIVLGANFSSPDSHLVKRVKNILGSRLRDIRGSEETARLLVRISEGHSELNREKVESLMKLTEQSFLDFQKKVIERGWQRERARLSRLREETLNKKKTDRDSEAADLNRRYKKLTGIDLPVVLPLPDLHTTDKMMLGGLSETGSINPETSQPPQTSAPKIPVQKREVTVTLSPNSVAPTSDKPKLNDIKYERQLMGPVEELRNMRLSDFRLLAREPKAAAEKIRAKIELLGAESYEKKVKGVAAWRQSEVMKSYLNATRDALDQGVPLATVLQNHKKTAPEALTLPECQAIRELNAVLRF